MKIKWKQINPSKWILDAGNEVDAVVEEEDTNEDGSRKFTVTVGDEAGDYIRIPSVTGEAKAKKLGEKYLKGMVRDYKKEVKKLTTIIKRVGV